MPHPSLRLRRPRRPHRPSRTDRQGLAVRRGQRGRTRPSAQATRSFTSSRTARQAQHHPRAALAVELLHGAHLARERPFEHPHPRALVDGRARIDGRQGPPGADPDETGSAASAGAGAEGARRRARWAIRARSRRRARGPWTSSASRVPCGGSPGRSRCGSRERIRARRFVPLVARASSCRHAVIDRAAGDGRRASPPPTRGSAPRPARGRPPRATMASSSSPWSSAACCAATERCTLQPSQNPCCSRSSRSRSRPRRSSPRRGRRDAPAVLGSAHLELLGKRSNHRGRARGRLGIGGEARAQRRHVAAGAADRDLHRGSSP